MFTLNKLRDTLSYVGGVLGQVTAAGCISLLARTAGADFAQEWNLV